MMHLFSGALEESTAARDEQRVASKHGFLLAFVRAHGDVIAYVSGRVTWCEECSHVQVWAYFKRLVVAYFIT